MCQECNELHMFQHSAHVLHDIWAVHLYIRMSKCRGSPFLFWRSHFLDYFLASLDLMSSASDIWDAYNLALENAGMFHVCPVSTCPCMRVCEKKSSELR